LGLALDAYGAVESRTTYLVLFTGTHELLELPVLLAVDQIVVFAKVMLEE
jgi:hypothetical protein